MQELTPEQRIKRGRDRSEGQHLDWLRSNAGAYYRYEYKQGQIQKTLPVPLRRTVSVPAVKPSAHTERHTDKYNLKNLALTDMIDLYVAVYQCKHKCLPTVISVSQGNMYLLSLQGFKHIYSNAYGKYLLVTDDQLDNDSILCS